MSGRRTGFESAIKNKYSHLLVSLIVIFLAAPFLDSLKIKFPMTHFLVLFMIVFTLRVMPLKRYVFGTTVSLALVGFTLEYMVSIGFIKVESLALASVILMSYALFLAMALVLLVKSIFSERIINSDTIKGGISVYLLMGFWWTVIYYLISLFDPGAFINSYGAQSDIDFQLFSFITLTTVGYGDVVPRSELAQIMVSLEAIAGPMYIAILIARLVSLHVLDRSRAV